ncbi:hypothetical protein AVEN_216868-1 [Araneus ventricosus]|uniref:Uncharacterized protein n=1 Tax=Araneus ventricosus TaxID=182803 RepID=A0A4Y2GD21_ARAVE|nr:hypothetical protein AVEN_216868-1 [Araneus ventricosus]
MTRTTPELAHPLQTSTPHQREDVWPLRIRAEQKNGLPNSLGTEFGVLIDINGHAPAPPEGGSSYYRRGDNLASHYYYAHQGSENRPTYQETSHQRTSEAIRWGSVSDQFCFEIHRKPPA